jgi:CBS domain-containing protein
VRLRDWLSADRIVVPLPGATLASAAEVLVERLVASGHVGDLAKLKRRIAEERAEDTMVIGNHACLLHYRTDAISELGVALGVTTAEIRRELRDGESQRARVILIVVAPPRQAARYFQIVRGFARVLSKAGSVERVLAVDSPDAVASLSLFEEYQLPEQLTVRDLMTERPRTTHPDVPLRDAAREMIRTGLGALPVVDDGGHLVGMLSERELIRHLLTTQVLADPLRHPSPLPSGRKTVRDVMTRQVLCVAPEQPIAEVASLMSNKDVERVPVVREGRLTGFLTRGDIVRKLLG